ncbi:unnamed protein product [Meganyctiphanes norvegica]|uniref:Uncharacterized protein n=1 Tax=Meganyctiphanes norvegica TaxID=48144 RepID=A0AAV2QN65_MEGNR
MCPRNYVYCLEKRECVPADRGCIARKGPTCPPGQVFCLQLGACSKNCKEESPDWAQDSATCPRMDADIGNQNPEYSTCLSSSHCPLGHTCCPSPENLHLQCVSSNGSNIASQGNQAQSLLNLTCLHLELDVYETGMNCSSPEDCPAGSVCCSNKCKTQGGRQMCPPSTLYCAEEESCKRAGSQCGSTCSPGHVYCIKKSQCIRKDDCQGDSTGGVPWTMPDLLLLSPNTSTSSDDIKFNPVLISETFTMSSTGPEQKNGKGKGMNLLKVYGVTSNFGIWTKRQKKNKGKWMNVTTNENLNIAHFIRFVPHRDIYGFGIDYIDMIDEISNTSRRLVQFLAPRPPKLELKVRTSSLQTNEDIPLTMPLALLLEISGEDKIYWSKWKEALDFPRLANSNGLLDISHLVVSSWVEMLTRPNLPSSQEPQMTRGISLRLEKKPTNVQKAKVHIAYSTNAGRTWKEQSPLSALELDLASPDEARKVMLQFIPGPSKSGRVVFLLEPFTKQLGRDIKKEKPEKITFEIKSQNDAPQPRNGFDVNLVPTLEPDQSNSGTTIKDLATIFYRDADKDDLGIAILYAGGGSLGAWEYALKERDPWSKISDLNEIPLPSTPSKSRSYQGVVDMQKAMKVQTCDPTALLQSAFQSSQSTENSVCSAALTAKSKGRDLNTKGRNDAQGVYEIENGNITTSMNYPTVLALLLPPSAKVRFEPKDSSVTWGKVEAITHTKLLFLAWDTSDAPNNEISRKNISLSTCKQCGRNGSMSLLPAVMISEWSDCGGRLVEGGSPRKLDQCGVCGGDGSSCLDCANVVNGSASMECGMCVGGNTGKTAKRDCAGQCGDQNLEQEVGGTTLCLLKSDSNFTLCDGTLNSGAYFNPCGICVEGETEMNKDAGIDQCGVCGGQNECLGCDGKVDSTASIDLCGKCLKKSDPKYNKCESLGKITPTIIDAAMFSLPTKSSNDASSASLRSTATTLKAKVAGLAENKNIIGCSLINVETLVETNVDNVKMSAQNIRVPVKTLEEGKYLMECTFGPKKKGKRKGRKLSSSDELTTLKSSVEDAITVVDSRKIEINIVDQKELESGTINEVSL